MGDRVGRLTLLMLPGGLLLPAVVLVLLLLLGLVFEQPLDGRVKVASGLCERLQTVLLAEAHSNQAGLGGGHSAISRRRHHRRDETRVKWEQ